MPLLRTPRGGTRKTVFETVAGLQIHDAEILLRNGRKNGAIYLAGYAVEFQLKYACCQRQNLVYLPEQLEIHDRDHLVSEAGLLADIKIQPAMEAIYSDLTGRWGPGLRYHTALYSEKEAKQLYKFFKDLVP